MPCIEYFGKLPLDPDLYRTEDEKKILLNFYEHFTTKNNCYSIHEFQLICEYNNFMVQNLDEALWLTGSVYFDGDHCFKDLYFCKQGNPNYHACGYFFRLDNKNDRLNVYTKNYRSLRAIKPVNNSVIAAGIKSNSWTLNDVKKSDKPDKKYVAVFSNGQRFKHVYFGAKGYDDFTLTGNKSQREKYLQRHKKDLLTNDPTKPGFLSYYILWGPNKSLQSNIKEFKHKFNV